MPNNILLKKGLDIPVSGISELSIRKVVDGIVAVCPTDFKGLLPRLLVKEGDSVLAGSPVISDKRFPEILVVSPVGGTVKEIVRGEQRKLLSIVIQPDGLKQSVDFGIKEIDELSAEEIRQSILQSGLWPFIVQRPFGTIANPSVTPKAIFASAFSSAPLAPDFEFTLAHEFKFIQAGVDALSKIAKVHFSVDRAASAFARIKNAELHIFKGKHPAGNVGVQIANIDPIKKGETVWTVSMEGLAAIGKLFLKGVCDLRRKVAVNGPAAIQPAYIDTLPGMPVSQVTGFYGNTPENIRFVSGDILSGATVGEEGYLRFFDNQITIIREGTNTELLGWCRPFRFRQYSADHSYFHWCLGWQRPGYKYEMDTNLHGGQRAFVMSDSYYGKVLPMDIYPLFLIKACIAGDIEKMEKFGIYEVLPEDLALCEFVDPSKNYIQDIIAKGIDLMLKEMA